LEVEQICKNTALFPQRPEIWGGEYVFADVTAGGDQVRKKIQSLLPERSWLYVDVNHTQFMKTVHVVGKTSLYSLDVVVPGDMAMGEKLAMEWIHRIGGWMVNTESFQKYQKQMMEALTTPWITPMSID
jgi:hypothetical protein